jgi:hypothetical protein
MYSVKFWLLRLKILKSDIWKEIWNLSLGLDPDAEITSNSNKNPLGTTNRDIM